MFSDGPRGRLRRAQGQAGRPEARARFPPPAEDQVVHRLPRRSAIAIAARTYSPKCATLGHASSRRSYLRG